MEQKLRTGDLVCHKRYGNLTIAEMYFDDTGEMAVYLCNIDGRKQFIHFPVEHLTKREIEPTPPVPFPSIGSMVKHDYFGEW